MGEGVADFIIEHLTTKIGSYQILIINVLKSTLKSTTPFLATPISFVKIG